MRLLDIISELMEGTPSSATLPSGIRSVEKVTAEAFRIEFQDGVDPRLLSKVAVKEGYTVEEGSFAARVVDRGAIVARMGSQSDPCRGHDLFIYLLPAKTSEMNAYVKTIAVMHRILDSRTGTLNLSRLLAYNLKVVRLVETYRAAIYERLVSNP